MGQINHAHEKFAAAPRHSYCVQSFATVMGTCVPIRGQYWIVNQQYAPKLKVSSDMVVDIIGEVKSVVVIAKVVYETINLYH